jgi:hypothetical protein
MPIGKRHHTKRHSFYGEELGIPVAEYLNDSGTPAGRARILSLLDQLLKLAGRPNYATGTIERTVDAVAREKQLPSYRDTYKSRKQGGRGSYRETYYRRLAASVNVSLARYKFSPMIWPFEHLPASKRKSEFAECESARNLVRLAEMGLLGSLRQCDQPHKSGGQWFFGKFAHQRFCGKQCQIRFNASTEKTKQRRRENYKYKLIQKERQSSRKGARHGNV